ARDSHCRAPVSSAARVRSHRLSSVGAWASGSDPGFDPHLWSIVLAGGDGTRLVDYVRERFGRPMPKQYCAFTGTRTMLQHTADRARWFAPPSRILTVVGSRHRQL